MLIALAPARIAAADDAQAARSLFKKGVEEYKAKKYGDASITLLKSYELDPKPDTLFALAQAERLDGRCPDAREHYKKLLEQTSDMSTAKAVQSNLELCAAPEPVEKPQPSDKPAEPVKPQIVTQTVVRRERTTDTLAVALFSSGALALGGSAALVLAARNSSADSDRAATLDESNRLYDRSKRERLLALGVAGVGAALVTGGIVHVLRGKPAQHTEVAVAPLAGGAAIALSSRW